MTDQEYVALWVRLKYGLKSPIPCKEEIEVLKKDFEGSKDYSPAPNEQGIEIYFCLN